MNMVVEIVLFFVGFFTAIALSVIVMMPYIWAKIHLDSDLFFWIFFVIITCGPLGYFIFINEQQIVTHVSYLFNLPEPLYEPNCPFEYGFTYCLVFFIYVCFLPSFILIPVLELIALIVIPIFMFFLTVYQNLRISVYVTLFLLASCTIDHSSGGRCRNSIVSLSSSAYISSGAQTFINRGVDKVLFISKGMHKELSLRLDGLM